MKVVPLTEAKAKLSRYGRLCHDEPVVLTVNGRPSFQLVPLERSDDLIDRLIEDHPAFADFCSGVFASVACRSIPRCGGLTRRRQSAARLGVTDKSRGLPKHARRIRS